MKFKKILMLDFTQQTLEPKVWKRIDAICEKKVLLPRDSAEVPQHYDADCIVVNFLPPVDKVRIDSMPNLKYIGILATGYGRIDANYAKTKNIPVCNIPGYSTEAVAEFAFAVILEHLREVERGKMEVRKGNYSEIGFKGSEIRGKKFGIVGLGSIGTRIVEIARDGFKCDVRYWNRTKKQINGVKYQELNELIKECDLLSLNLTSNKETKGIINEPLIQTIKPGAIVVNLAPMELVDINALEQRLAKGDITFILDHSDEMKKEDVQRLEKYKNCVIYPPIAFVTKEASENKQEIFVSNLEKFLQGKPQNKVN